MDGWVILGTKLDSKQLEKDLKQAERRLQQFEKEAEKLTKAKTKAEIDLAPYEEQKRLIQEMTDERNRYAQTEAEVTNNLNLEKTQLDELNEKYSKQINNLEDINRKIKENAKNQGLVTNEIGETNAKLQQAKGINSIKNVMENINKSTSKTIKQIGRWALAVFGVRSAYMFVRQAMSTLSQYNEQMATDLEYIRFAIASSLESLIQRLIKLTYTLLTYVNYIAQAWFGVNLFANASADAMNKSAKSAEKMKKSMSGFDEMNVLSDSSSSNTSSVNAPSLDLSAPEDVQIPSWLQWIADNKDIVIAGLAGIAGGLIAVYLGLAPIQGLGIGLILAGVALAIQGIVDFIKDPSWNNFLTILQGISLVVAGIAVLMGGWTVALVALGVAIVAYVIQNWDKVKEILGIVGSWVYENIVLPVWNFIQGLFDTILSIIKTTISVINGIFITLINIITNPFIVAYDTVVGVFNGIKKTIQGVFDVIAGLFTGDWKRVMNGFKNIFKGVFDTLWSIAKAPINLIIGGINALIKGANKISFDVPDWVPGLGGKKFGFNIPTIPKLAVGGIVNMPGRGVPIGGAITGEAGAEGVIPLTDSQAMETLGAAIGKYITINASITNNMNGRVISRELQKVNSSSDFAFNR